MRKHLTALIVLSTTTAAIATAPTATAAAPNQIIVADQGTGDHLHGQRVSVLRQNAANWNSPSAEDWHWVPPATDPRWRGITDAKVRTQADKRRVVLVTAGAGRVAKIAWDTHEILWTSTVPAGDNAHSVELLPDGQIVVAGSAGHLRFFPAGAAQNSKPTSSEKLRGAHGVLYNDKRLWALGTTELKQYDIRKNSLAEAKPTIPVPGNGHDLALVHGTANHEMWLTNTRDVYRYDKYSGKPPQRVKGPHGGRKVKSAGNQPDGTIIQTRPHDTNTRGQCSKDFLTPTVNLFDADGGNARTKTKRGSCFYKARPVVWTYY